MNMKKNNEIAAVERDEKTLYICLQLREYDNGDSSKSWLIQAVNLNHLLLPSPSSCSSITSDTSTKLVRTVARLSDHDLPSRPCCCAFGSKILFAGRARRKNSTQVYVFETDPNVDPKLEINKSCFRSFVNGKDQTLLMELDDGNLYSLSGSHYRSKRRPPLPAFEFFNLSEPKWSALPDPPLFEDRGRPGWSDICCATVGNDILLSSPLDPRMLYCFDAAAQLWTKHSTVDPIMSSAGRALVLNCDGGFVMFTFSGKSSHMDSIQVYQMSKEYEHLRHIESHQMPHHDHSSPTPEDDKYGDYDFDGTYSFVHLGGRQVCLVLAYNDWYEGEGLKLTMVVVMFEYAIADKKKKNKKKKKKKSGEASFGQFNFLNNEDPEQSHVPYVLGAFVVPPHRLVPVVLPKKRKAVDGM